MKIEIDECTKKIIKYSFFLQIWQNICNNTVITDVETLKNPFENNSTIFPKLSINVELKFYERIQYLIQIKIVCILTTILDD